MLGFPAYDFLTTAAAGLIQSPEARSCMLHHVIEFIRASLNGL